MDGVALWRRLLAEGLGSALLAAVVIGSGIAAQRLSPGNVGLELFENAAGDRGRSVHHHLDVRPVSGGHFNPVVSFVDAAFGGLSWRDAVAYLPAQVSGCVGGAVSANLMFVQGRRHLLDQAPGFRALTVLPEVVATARSLARDLLARPHRARTDRPAAVGCLHRCRLLLHELDELRQPGHHGREDVLGHFRRDRPCLGALVRPGGARRWSARVPPHQDALPRRHPRGGVRCGDAAPSGRRRPDAGCRTARARNPSLPAAAVDPSPQRRRHAAAISPRLRPPAS